MSRLITCSKKNLIFVNSKNQRITFFPFSLNENRIKENKDFLIESTFLYKF